MEHYDPKAAEQHLRDRQVANASFLASAIAVPKACGSNNAHPHVLNRCTRKIYNDQSQPVIVATKRI